MSRCVMRILIKRPHWQTGDQGRADSADHNTVFNGRDCDLVIPLTCCERIRMGVYILLHTHDRDSVDRHQRVAKAGNSRRRRWLPDVSVVLSVPHFRASWSRSCFRRPGSNDALVVRAVRSTSLTTANLNPPRNVGNDLVQCVTFVVSDLHCLFGLCGWVNHLRLRLLLTSIVLHLFSR
jgi:hypothetical protein